MPDHLHFLLGFPLSPINPVDPAKEDTVETLHRFIQEYNTRMTRKLIKSSQIGSHFNYHGSKYGRLLPRVAERINLPADFRAATLAKRIV